MAQTTLAASSRNAVVEISTDGSTWTDISGYAQSVSPGDGTRLTGTPTPSVVTAPSSWPARPCRTGPAGMAAIRCAMRVA